MMLVKIIRRAKELIASGQQVEAATEELNFFSAKSTTISNTSIEQHLDIFCRLDDHDIMATIKNWCHHPDKILSTALPFFSGTEIAENKTAGGTI